MILCCGEALIDMLPETMPTGSVAFVPHAGGAVYNTAIGLGRLGMSVGLLTGLSSDRFGHILQSGLRASNVDLSHVVVSDRPTTLAFVHLIDGQASYSFFDENSAGRLLQTSDIPRLSDDVTTLFFGGISLAAEPCADTYAEILEQQSADRLVMLDPNIRPDFIEDESRYRTRLDCMIASADIVKISDEDMHWMIPGNVPEETKAGTLLSKGPSMVILTKGTDGATAFLKNGGSVHVEAHSANVVDTVGAGDTFNAGILAALSRSNGLTKHALGKMTRETVEDALEYAARAAAVTVSRAGANPPWAHEI